MSALDRLLDTYRTIAISKRDQGAAFEKLISAWLKTDPVQANRFSIVEDWATWAGRHQLPRTDTGIDLVATRYDGGFAAVQCKFIDHKRQVRKQDIDSFISASAKHQFVERLIVETTDVPWSSNAETMLLGQTIPITRIGLRELRESQVDWSIFAATGEIIRPTPKTLRPDQIEALNAVQVGLAGAERGKLIMACGTGKTLTALRIAEEVVNSGGYVLLLVPSLALMSQSIREWCVDAIVQITSFAVCSDTQVGRKRRNTNDIAELESTDLAIPPTTNAQSLAYAVRASDDGNMRVVFATYQSISVVASAQADHDLPDFDLIVCDEAHRTTGVTFSGEDHSNFVKVHDNEIIKGRKRLYMTATPRIYGESAKSTARESDAVLASMDDPELFGKVLFHHGFSRAVESNILTDYRVVVLVMDEQQVSTAVQNRLTDEDSELVLDDATKIVGCWKALSKTELIEEGATNLKPMRRALAFCRNIKNSKLVRDEFERVVLEYHSASSDEFHHSLKCEVRHVDGTYNARERGERLDWLKEDAGDNVCRILSNARCLTEGVDLPALDAILFFHPRNSQIDVVQAVGRVMRSSPGKGMGYVILPIGVPHGIPAHQALNDNKRYRVVWQILNALRAHDERLDAVINQGGLGQDISDRIAIIDGRSSIDSAEIDVVTAIVEDLPKRKSKKLGLGIGGSGTSPSDRPNDGQEVMPIVIDEFTRAVMAKIVEKCGTRDYWEDWAGDVASIAERHIVRISSLIADPRSDARNFFDDFLDELRYDLNESITEQHAIEMLAQHLITRPVFDALFEGHDFVERNPVSVAMSEILSVIDESQIEREANSLEGFYDSVRRRATGITDPKARQNLIVELYDKFFRRAFPRTTKMLGIVYTPVEVVDFIIQSVSEVLENEFDKPLGSDGVHILDPFVGTGTFITRLLQSGLIPQNRLTHKYCEEIHANDIVLLAYYIAAINIESVFHAVVDGEEYLPYTGICLTDTFALHEGDEELSFYMKDNTDRRERQKNTDIRVIVGNPPYSFGQKSEDDNAKNVAYLNLDERIRSSYVRESRASNLQNLYDSYIRAIRWGSDRLGNAGVMAYISGAAWIDRNFADGLRKCLAQEFSSIYIFHLRGDIRKNILSSGKAAEGENIFGSGTMTGVAISLFVKNPEKGDQCKIFFHEVGDKLNRQEKLDTIKYFGSINGIEKVVGWTEIVPDEYGDWLNQRDSSIEIYPKIGDRLDTTKVLFKNYSLGVSTNRDAWCINPSRLELTEKVRSTIDFYNSELARWEDFAAQSKLGGHLPSIDDFVNYDRTKISWTPKVKRDLFNGKSIQLNDGQFVQVLYRPFSKQWSFYSRRFNERVYQMPQIFPNAELPNRVIAVTGNASRSGLSVLMSDRLVDLNLLEAGAQCFPQWIYKQEDSQSQQADILRMRNVQSGWVRSEAITDSAMTHFNAAYPEEDVSREDIFYYIYGLFHSEDYRSRFRANPAKELPRIPCVNTVEDYRVLRDAGKKLGDLHVNYESVEPYDAKIDTNSQVFQSSPEQTYRVDKMRHPGSGSNKDLTTVLYNSYITIREIPQEAYDYVVSGRSALSWVMERQRVKTDSVSQIVSDSNCYAIETAGDPRYPLDLFLRVVTVSLETMKIVHSLPELKLD